MAKAMRFWCTRRGYFAYGSCRAWSTIKAAREANPLPAIEYKQSPRTIKSCSGVVYPPGLEPGVDGVGGHNVIQLHYEYAPSLFSHYSTFPEKMLYIFAGIW